MKNASGLVNRHLRIALAGLLAVALLGAACSSTEDGGAPVARQGGAEHAPADAADGDETTPESGSSKASKGSPGSQGNGHEGDETGGPGAETSLDGVDKSGPRGDQSSGGRGNGPDAGPRAGKQDPKRQATARVDDPPRDPEGEGDAPAYMDLTSVTLQRNQGLLMTLRFAQDLPARMPDGQSNMLAGVDLRIGKEEISIYAEGSENGWRPRSSHSSPSEFPGTLSRAGDTFVFQVSKSLVGDANRFTWYGHSSWTKSTLTSTDYAFDQAPDVQRGRFPGSG